MPFIDTRCNVWDIKLNVEELLGELESMLAKEYSGDIKEGSKFWLYVIQIENALNKCDTMPDFWEWFLTDKNYNNVEMWDEIQDLFVESEYLSAFCGDGVYAKLCQENEENFDKVVAQINNAKIYQENDS